MTARRTANLMIRLPDGRVRAMVSWKLGIQVRAIVCGLGLVALLPAAVQGAGDTPAAPGMPPALLRAQKIRAQINARYLAPGGPKLAVTEASSTAVVESFSLPAPEGLRVVPTDGGIYFAICPQHARCPRPAGASARPAAAFLPRRQALELALRTFVETSADVVAVSLPTTRFVLFIVERGELERDVNMSTLV